MRMIHGRLTVRDKKSNNQFILESILLKWRMLFSFKLIEQAL